jgi:hypothetical protein
MYFPQKWEFCSALSKLQNFGGGTPKPPLATDHDCALFQSQTFFYESRAAKQVIKKTIVSWWTGELKVLRKRVNGLLGRYQRTTNNDNLR